MRLRSENQTPAAPTSPPLLLLSPAFTNAPAALPDHLQYLGTQPSPIYHGLDPAASIHRPYLGTRRPLSHFLDLGIQLHQDVVMG